jgi:hypothetical protein
MKRFISVVILMSAWIFGIHAQPEVTRISDVVYDHRDGAALVFDVLVPEKQNGIAVFRLVSGGWMSFNAAFYEADDFKAFTDKGITVFLVSHGSKPRYKVPEIIDQLTVCLMMPDSGGLVNPHGLPENTFVHGHLHKQNDF